MAQCFVNQNRIRQAAASLGAAAYCIEESVQYARERKPFGKPLPANQAIQFPLVELATQAEALRLLIYKTAQAMDGMTLEERGGDDLRPRLDVQLLGEPPVLRSRGPGDSDARGHRVLAAQALRAHLSPSPPLRITEGSEEVQMRKVGAFLFGYRGPRRTEH